MTFPLVMQTWDGKGFQAGECEQMPKVHTRALLTTCDKAYMTSIDKWKQPFRTRYNLDYRGDSSPAINTALVEPEVKNCSSGAQKDHVGSEICTQGSNG